MAGTIEHEWEGSILTVSSDSGTSSSDLKGPKGDTGPRGPQGAPGVIYDAEGQVVVDLSPYATMDDVAAAIDNIPEVDMAKYATRTFVSTSIAKAQLEGAGVDTSGFATLDDLEGIEVNIDNQTIIKGSNGNLRTAIGGFANNGGGVDYALTGIEYAPSGPWNNYARPAIGNIGKDWAAGCLYHITMTFKDGDVVTFDAMFEMKESEYAGEIDYLDMVSEYKNDFLAKVKTSHNIANFYVGPTNFATSFNGGDFAYAIRGDENDDGVCDDKYILTGITIKAEGYVPIDGRYIPVDGTSVYLNEEGKLASAGGGGSANLEDYYTKSEVDSLIQNTDLTNYYTKSQVDAKITYGLVDITAGETALATGSLYMVYE